MPPPQKKKKTFQVKLHLDVLGEKDDNIYISCIVYTHVYGSWMVIYIHISYRYNKYIYIQYELIIHNHMYLQSHSVICSFSLQKIPQGHLKVNILNYKG